MAENELFPEILGYRIEKKLGRGGMAEVYLGIQETLGRRVAVKILNPLMVKNRQLLQRFINEAKTASRLAHPNIVTVHDVGQVNNFCYIVMEYLQESLVDRIRFSPELKLNIKEALLIIRQIARALAYAHNEGFIHRDIKPDNILFRKDNTPVLGDFGIARAMDSESQLTTVGMIIGTPHYMSPEQCRGEKIDGQSDIYSLGVVFYEMLTGRIPYKADSAAGVLVKHIQEPVPRLPRELTRYQSLLDSMMAKDKSQRIHTAEELLKVLDLYLPESPLNTIKASQPDQYVFDGPSPTPTPYPQNNHQQISSDYQPTILSPVPGIPKLKNVLLLLLLLLFLIAGGYFAYNQWFHPKNGATSKENNSKPVMTDIEVNEAEPVLPNSSGKVTAVTPLKDGNTPKNDHSSTPDGRPVDKQKEPSAKAVNSQDQKYSTLLGMAQEYFKDADMEKAKEKLDQAAAIKTTPETQALQQRINDFLEAQQDKEYKDFLSRATADLKKGNTRSARKYMVLAQRIKKTAELVKLNQEIEHTERVTRETTRKIKLDDDAYNIVRSSNSLSSLEKYLKMYPNGRHAAEAQEKLNQLKGVTSLEIKINDDVAFETATKSDTVAAYQKYLQDNPIGQHVKEATTRLEALKVKLLKETKERIVVKRIRFFESTAQSPAIEQRTYNTRFPKTTTRYIHVEIDYENKLFRVADCSASMSIDFNGPFQQQLKGTIDASKSSATGTYGRGMGWVEVGKWPVGRFAVTVTIDGQKAGQANFEIY